MAMLLYEAPPGIAIFSVDGGYLDDPAKSFWECLPPLSLKEFITNETVPSPIDTTNKAIDNHLAKRLTELCGSEKKLVVGNADYKRIIEISLRITCLHVDVPDCEVVICSLRNPMFTLLPRKLLNPAEDLTLFLKQHDIGFKPEMVNSSIVKVAHSLHENESREKEYLKFFRLLLKDFLVNSGIDAARWNSIHFATALKVICYPDASYVVYRPDKIFPCGVYQKIKDHASGYDIIFHKIDVLSVYNEVISLNSDIFLLLGELDILLMKDKEDLKMAEAIRLCEDHSSGKPCRTGSKVHKEASANVDGRLYKVQKKASTNVDDRPYTVRKEAISNVDGRSYKVRKEASTNVDGRPYKVRKEASTNVDGRPYKVRKEATSNVDGRLYSELDFSRGRQEHDVKQTHTILEGNPPVERPSGLYNEEIYNKKKEEQHWLDRRIYRDVPPQVKRRLLRRMRAAGACGES